MNSYDMLDARDVVVYHLDTMINPANGLTAAEGRDRFARSMDAVTGRDPVGPPAPKLKPHVKYTSDGRNN